MSIEYETSGLTHAIPKVKQLTESAEGGHRHFHSSPTHCRFCTGEAAEPCAHLCRVSRLESHEHLYPYMRVSQWGRPKERTDRHQLKQIQKHLGRRDQRVLGGYLDRNISVKVKALQPDFERLLADVANDPYSHKRLVCSNIDRITRNVAQGIEYWGRFEALGLVVETPSRLYLHNQEGREAFLTDVYDAYRNNQRRGQGSKRSHQTSQSKEGWRYRAYAGYEKVGTTSLAVLDGWRPIFARIEASACSTAIENVLLGLEEDFPTWRFGFKSKSRAKRLKNLRDIYQDPRNAGFKSVDTGNGYGYEEVTSGGWEAVFSYDFFMRLQMLFPSARQLALLSSEKLYLKGKMRCIECQRQMKPTGVHFLDPLTGEEYANFTGFVCPPRRLGAKNKVPFCSTRQVLGSESIDAQMPTVLAALALKRGKPRDLVEQWFALSEQERPSFIKQWLKQTVVVDRGVLRLK